MATSTRVKDMFGALARLRVSVTEEGIELLRGERFPEAQALTQISQELKELEARLGGLLGNGAAGASAESASAGRPTKAFPRYVRQGDMLVRIGQRRDRKGTYEQKIARSEFEEIVQALNRIAGEKPEFEAPDVIKSVSCPAYQVYLVLGLLQEGGHLESPRRGRYRLQGENGGWAVQAWEQAGAKG